ncbi:tRNA (guanosine(37)-N1)-methyltransferase TrmD [Jeotgalibaca ciconiae]|uniref:tRNA (guanine-N(1)-)-methyltransferase n=1 Tax=Jeotgalibaca ciconiae TaxID=2496265 RepID=A0A3S9HCW5_9LACT|nr:tRNA (guanosine(37)-N1)-methyltransferase TrmD [Jeotgalibaca ciconiae]AZP05225.1 tRNA (guanosine(37)-N1)-methyltransferase TrmD [Jeotgalibaca ciconiae]
MRIDVLTLFPNMFDGPMSESIIGKAIEKELVEIKTTNFRDYTENKHNMVDDYPFGGGAGMLLTAQPIVDSIDAIKKSQPETKKRIILMDPAGKKYDQKLAEELSQEEHLIFICGHYEGFDERIKSHVTDEVSIGDFILTGGELGAMVIIDSVVRLLPETLGNVLSNQTDSFSTGLLEHPQYTRPRSFRGEEVPEVLLSGNHAKIAEWQEKASLRKTLERRPDLLEKIELTEQQEKWLQEIKEELDE